jgi:elongation factor Ts
MDCKRALESCEGGLDQAVQFLRERGLSAVAKRESRTATEGTIAPYLHAGGKIGVLVEVSCETDFAAKTADMQAFAKDVAMQIAATQPDYVSREEVPAEVIEAERAIYVAAAEKEGKPEQIRGKIAEGRLEKYYSQVCLLDQAYIRDPDKTIKDLLTEVAAKVGEKVSIRRFVRYQVGQ